VTLDHRIPCPRELRSKRAVVLIRPIHQQIQSGKLEIFYSIARKVHDGIRRHPLFSVSHHVTLISDDFLRESVRRT
jgi:hypothetical protein